MVTADEVRAKLDEYGFDGLQECLTDQIFRFKTSAIHHGRNIRVVLYAPMRFVSSTRRFSQPMGRRSVMVEVRDGACRPLPGVRPVIITNRLCEIEKILQKVKDGAYS